MVDLRRFTSAIVGHNFKLEEDHVLEELSKDITFEKYDEESFVVNIQHLHSPYVNLNEHKQKRFQDVHCKALTELVGLVERKAKQTFGKLDLESTALVNPIMDFREQFTRIRNNAGIYYNKVSKPEIVSGERYLGDQVLLEEIDFIFKPYHSFTGCEVEAYLKVSPSRWIDYQGRGIDYHSPIYLKHFT